MLEPTFQFTQSNIQDYLTCQRRFELRYLRRMSWPAVESAPIHEAERRMQLGSHFHRLIHQHLLGMTAQRLTDSVNGSAEIIDAPELSQLWHNYLAHRPNELNTPGIKLFPEMILSTMAGSHRLLAKYDLIAVMPSDDSRIFIIDWKTSTRRPTSDQLKGQAQSRVYPYVLAKAGALINQNQPITPEAITMIYWFANAPDQPEIIPYSQAQFSQDDAFLSNLVDDIGSRSEFPLTDKQVSCQTCVYRSFCDRGRDAGPLDAFEDDLALDELDLDWEQISEVAY